MSADASQKFQTGGGGETSMTDEDVGDNIQTAPSTAAQASERNNFEFNQKMNEVFEWIETKVELLKILQANVEEEEDENQKDSSVEETHSMLEGMLEDIGKITSKERSVPDNSISEEVTKMLDMLQETTIGMLDSLNPFEKRCRSIKVLATLIQHLSASAGTKVTLEDVQKHINGERVMDLYSEVQVSNEPLLVKMESAKRYIGHGIRKTQNIGRKSKKYSDQVNGFFSRNSSSDLMSMNAKWKAMAKDSEYLLVKYSDSIGYLVAKTRSFIGLKQDSERLMASFMTKEIEDMYKTQF